MNNLSTYSKPCLSAWRSVAIKQNVCSDPYIAHFTSPDSIIPESYNTLDYQRYAYARYNPLKYSDPTGHDPVSEFALGFASEFVRVNAWWHPQAQQALSVMSSESDAMIVGRIAGDVAAAVVGAVEMADGVGIAGGGAVIGCGTTLCMASGAAVTVGAAIALQGVGTGVNAAAGIAQNFAGLTSQSRSSNNDQPLGGTYILRDPETGEVVRTGRTNDLSRRAAEHARDSRFSKYEFEIDWRVDDYAVQRGREQMLHDVYNPPLNQIRPISPYNPRYNQYINAANAFVQTR